MIASKAMKTRATVFSLVKVVGLVVGLAACGGSPRGKLVVETSVLPYQPPDISEITGIEEPDGDASDGSGSAEPGK